MAESSRATAREHRIRIVFIPHIEQAADGLSQLERTKLRLRVGLDEVRLAAIAGPHLECHAARGRDSAREPAE